MTALVVILAAALVVLLTISVGRERSRRSPKLTTPSPARVVFPFVGTALSQRGLDAALRLARVDSATLVPLFLAQVPLHLPLDAALPVQCDAALPLLEAIEQAVSSQGLPVDSRVGRGRSARDALRRLLEAEQFDRIIVSADEDPRVGLSYDDLRWLLERVPAEILILRPAPEDTRRVSLEAVRGHF